MNVVVLDQGEHAAEVPDYAGLAAVMDMAAPHDMRTDVLLVPTFVTRLQDAVTLGLCTILVFPFQPLVVVVGLQIFAERNAGAFGLVDFAVLDDPAFGPVRTDHAVLISGRRRPLCRGFAYGKTGQRDISDSFGRRQETVLPYRDFNILRVRVEALKIRENQGFILLFVLLGIPAVQGKFRFPGAGKRFRIFHLIEGSNLVHGLVIQVYFSGMGKDHAVEPVARDPGCVGVIV